MLGAALLVVSAAAAADSGIYLGGGVGRGVIHDQQTVPGVGTLTLDAKHSTYKGFIGYRFAGLPIVDLAAEAAYTDFSTPSTTSSGQNFQYTLHGPSAAALAILPLGPVDLFGKWGVMSWNLDRSVNNVNTTNKGTSPVYGAGVGFWLGPVGVRAEYEYFAVKNIQSAQMASVSLLFQF
jgi:hypothetical protein